MSNFSDLEGGINYSENVVIMQGFRAYPDQPFVFDFLMLPPQHNISSSDFQNESQKLIRYFIAALTIPEKDLWVNLSPFEKDRVIPEYLGRTELGQVMLQQDYELKKMTAEYLSPENEVGKAFWEEVYQRVYEKYQITEIPLDSFNKIWIAPDRIEFHQTRDSIVIVRSRLKLLLQEDYLALKNEQSSGEESEDEREIHRMISETVKEKVLPVLEEKINSSEVFAPLRQIFHSVALAVWFKKQFQSRFSANSYLDHNQISGIDYFSERDVNQLYKHYVDIFSRDNRQSVLEEYDQQTQQVVIKHYVAGGVDQTHLIDSVYNVSEIPDYSVIPIHAVLNERDLAMMNETVQFDVESFAPPGIDSRIHQGKKVLVTGGDGYIGMSVVKALLEAGSRVIVLSRSTSREQKEFLHSKGVKVYEVDLVDEDQLSRAMTEMVSDGLIDSVVHLAGATRPQESVSNPSKYYLHNVIGTTNLLKVMNNLGIQNIVFSSSVAVYTGDSREPINENSEIGLRNSYAATKWFDEQILRQLLVKSPFKSTILRISNVAGALEWDQFWYGPMHEVRQLANKKTAVALSVISRLAQMAVLVEREQETEEKDESLTPFILSGNAAREFISPQTVAYFVVRSLAREYSTTDSNSWTFNVGSGQITQINDLPEIVEQATGVKIPVENDAVNRPFEAQSLRLDLAYMYRTLGFVPGQNIIDIVKSTYLFHKNKMPVEEHKSEVGELSEAEQVKIIIEQVDSNSMINSKVKFEILFHLFVSLLYPHRDAVFEKEGVLLFNRSKLENFFEKAQKYILKSNGQIYEIFAQDKKFWRQFKFLNKYLKDKSRLRIFCELLLFWNFSSPERKIWKRYGLGGRKEYLQQTENLEYLRKLHQKIVHYYQQVSLDAASLVENETNGGVDFSSTLESVHTNQSFDFNAVGGWVFPQEQGLVPVVLWVGENQSVQKYLRNFPKNLPNSN